MLLEELKISSVEISDLCPECQYENIGTTDIARLSQLSDNTTTVEFVCRHCGATIDIEINCVKQVKCEN